MNKRHYEHTLPNIRGSLSNTYPHTDNEYTVVADLCKCYRFVRHIICCHKGISMHIPEAGKKTFPGYYELFGLTGYSEEDYIRLSEEKYMGHTKTTKTSSKNKF